MTRIKTMVFVLGTALALLVPAVAQAQTVEVNNNSSTESTSTATSGGHSASTTTKGVGSTEIEVEGGVESLEVDSTGSSSTAAVAGPDSASATGNSTNESEIDLDCGRFGCGATVTCVHTICNPVHTPGFHHVRPVPHFTFVPFPVVPVDRSIEVGRDFHSCENGDVEGLVNVGADCLSLLNDLSLDVSDLIDLGDVNLLSDLALDSVLNNLLGSGGGLLGLDGLLGGLL